MNLATVVLMLCALVVTGLVLRRELSPSGAAAEVAEVRTVADWRRYATSGHRMGPAGAPVTIVEFSDFQCPACRVLAGRLRELRARHPDRVAVLYRHFPLPSHPFAEPAAQASDCAARQGRFEAFHDALYSRQESIGSTPWTSFAQMANIPDLPSFERCMRGGASPGLARDRAAGGELGVNATPTLLVNGVVLRGAPTVEALEQLVTRGE